METPTCEIFSVERYCSWRERDISGVMYPSFGLQNQSSCLQSLMAGANMFDFEVIILFVL